jgi:succinyl-diaminopimelate desuccinylase
VHGVQGHVAYPERADNPVHRFAPALAELCATEWDQGNAYFPPTSFQVANIQAGTGANNVIPGDLDVMFNFRYGTAQTLQGLQQRVEAILHRHGLRFSLRWAHSGHPFLTDSGDLLPATVAAIREQCGVEPDVNTKGGTSDGRFIAPTGAQVLELGPLNATIHKIDEHIPLADLEQLSALYEAILRRLLG